MKNVFSTAKISNKSLPKEEEQMFYYAVKNRAGDMRLKQCGLKPKENSWRTN